MTTLPDLALPIFGLALAGARAANGALHWQRHALAASRLPQLRRIADGGAGLGAAAAQRGLEAQDAPEEAAHRARSHHIVATQNPQAQGARRGI